LRLEIPQTFDQSVVKIKGQKDKETKRKKDKKTKTSPQAKRHKPSLLFTSLTILTFITR